MFTLYKMTFYLKFLSLTVKFGPNKNIILKFFLIKILNYNKLTNKNKILLEKISLEKIVLEDCYITAE